MREINYLSEIGPQTYFIDGAKIKVPEFGFPPASINSRSTEVVYRNMSEVKDKKILDVGTGTGVLAILAAIKGAREVDAFDIDEDSIRVAEENILANKVENKVNLFVEDSMESFLTKRYDVIIANLPYLNLPLPNNNVRWYTLFDPGLLIHKEVFGKGIELLNEGGKIISSHADMLGTDEFSRIEYIANEFGLKNKVVDEIIYRDVSWRKYEFEKR